MSKKKMIRLTVAQERQLARRWRKSKDTAALHELVESNLGFAHHAARQFSQYGVPFDDRHQVARLGLLWAAHRYDPEAPARFSTFATVVMRQTLVDFVSRQTRSGVTIGNDHNRRKAVFDLGKILSELADDGVEPTPELLAERLGVPLDTAVALDAATRPPAALDQPVVEDSDIVALIDTIPDQAPDAEAQLIASEQSRALYAGLERLDLTDQRIVALLYIDELPPREVGIQLGLPRREVLARGAAALARLRKTIPNSE